MNNLEKQVIEKIILKQWNDAFDEIQKTHDALRNATNETSLVDLKKQTVEPLITAKQLLNEMQRWLNCFIEGNDE